MNRPLAFLDTETDGLTPDRRIWEIAIIRRDTDGNETEWSAFLEINLSKANLQGLYIGRFYDRHPMGRRLSGQDTLPLGVAAWSGREATPLDQAASTIARLTHGATIIGAVPNFDTEAIDHLLRREGLTPAWDHRLRCVETLAAGHLGREPGGLDNTITALGLPPIPTTDRHTALGDTRAARDIYDAIMTSKALAA